MTEENKHYNIRQEAAKADRELTQGILLRDAGQFDGAVGKAYFCAFHYAQGMLMALGLQSRTHHGVRQLINQHFVQTGRLAPEIARYLSNLEGDRLISDYDATAVFTASMAAEAISKAEAYRDAARRLLVEDSWLE